MICGACARPFSAVGRDYLACLSARNGQGCRNRRMIRRPTLEARVLQALGSRLMRPDLVQAFCKEFIAEWNRLAGDASAGAEARQRELQAVERKIQNIIEAIADGLKAAGIQKKLAELEARRDELREGLSKAPASPSALLPNLAQVYARNVADLRRAIEAGKQAEVLQAARALIDKVIVTPGDGPDDPPGIELISHLMTMLEAAEAFPAGPDATSLDLVEAVASGSVKGPMRGRCPPRDATAPARPRTPSPWRRSPRFPGWSCRRRTPRPRTARAVRAASASGSAASRR